MSFPIEICDLSVRFRSRGGDVDALQSVSLAVEEGSVVGFLGPNGAGKTTTVHVLLGFTDATSGCAKLFGDDVRRSISRQRIGYLPEHPQTYAFLTAHELLCFAGKLFGLRGASLLRRVDELIDLVGLTEASRRRVGTFSRGMMQRVGLAQALINDPDLLILDEPTGGLDPIGRLDVRTIISGLRERGKTVFFSSHELSEVERVCDQVVLLVGGRIVRKGPVSELVGTDESLEQYFLRTVAETGSGEGVDAR